MDREIKFRLYAFPGWDKTKAIIVWDDFHYSIRPNWIVCLWWHNGNTIADEEYYKLVQYTWLKDKNWKEIYEWDIVKSQQNEIWVVWFFNDLTWDSGWSSHSWYYCKEWMLTSNYNELSYQSWFDNCIIIGNIYENPYLITNQTDG